MNIYVYISVAMSRDILSPRKTIWGDDE